MRDATNCAITPRRGTARPRRTRLSRALALAAALGAGFGSAPPAAAEQCGEASYYAARFDGRTTASGEPYDHDGLTAAHRTLAFGARVRVRRQDADKVVELRINDRGPYAEDRIIDVSGAAAEALDLVTVGVAPVCVEVLDPAD